MDLTNSLEDVIRCRIYNRLPVSWLFKQGIKQIYVAGNCLNRESPHDIDLFPVVSCDFAPIKEFDVPGLLVRTKNADTFLTNDGVKVQFCWYEHPTLEDLVQSFDFAHVQIGAMVKIESEYSSVVHKIYYSDDWLKAHAMESTRYVHSAYPLSSLMRLIKYAERDCFSGRAYIPSIINILIDIIQRGFTNYEDFKDQLDAVDLGLVDEDLKECNLMKLFDLLKKSDKGVFDADKW